jgi:oligopeptide/dipeptide ABC transporter ATP-binding protein
VEKQLLEIKDLKTYFYLKEGAVKAVDGISLNVRENEIVGVVGESGSGKTATALSILRLVQYPGRTVGGEILFKGKDLLAIKPEEMREIRGKQISMVFQDPMTFLNPVMKVGDQIAEAVRIHQGVDRGKAREEARRLLETVLIPSPGLIVDYYPHQLSGGMKQRIVIAIAISCNPSLIIADEPTTALDVTVQMQILSLLKEIKKKLGTSILLITHDLGIVAGVCDRVYVMYAGKIAEAASVADLYGEPLHPYTQGLLRSTLSIDEFRTQLETIEGSVPSLLFPPEGCRFHPRCPYMMEVCKEQPDLFKEKGHEVACWLYR